jgi:hypothetical protein
MPNKEVREHRLVPQVFQAEVLERAPPRQALGEAWS